MDELSSALTIISGMITPAVLILACASLAISVSNRLGRTMDRTRNLLAHLKSGSSEGGRGGDDKELRFLFRQLDKSARRCRLLHHALAGLYLAISFFVATSVAIAVLAITGTHYAWIPILLGLGGSGLLLFAGFVLIVESRVGNQAIEEELSFSVRLARGHLSASAKETPSNDRRFRAE